MTAKKQAPDDDAIEQPADDDDATQVDDVESRPHIVNPGPPD